MRIGKIGYRIVKQNRNGSRERKGGSAIGVEGAG